MHDATFSSIDVWLDAALKGGAWTDALESTRRALGADALALSITLPGRPSETMTAPASASDFDAMMATGGVMRAVAGAPRGDAITLELAACGASPEAAQDLKQAATAALRAVQVRTQMAALEANAALTLAAFDLLPFGVALVDAGLELKDHNLSFKTIVARADALVLRDRRLQCRSRSDHQALLRHVSEALSGAAAPDLLRVSRPGGERPYVLRALGRPGSAKSHCLLLLLDPDRAPAADSAVWKAMFDLTACELIIAEGLVHGRRIHEIAAQRGVSVETVRTQSKRLYERLNVTSQAAATALLAQAAPFLAAVR
jgi:DNA-binding NarL/FixJ family response regulator